MKTFTFRYDSKAKNLKDLGAAMLKAARSRKPDVQPEGEIRSGSFKALLSVATENRLTMFRTIVQSKPSSLLELAEVLEKDQAYVLKEARVLEGLGLIELRREMSEGREKVRPVALYDRIVLDFEMAKEKVS